MDTPTSEAPNDGLYQRTEALLKFLSIAFKRGDFILCQCNSQRGDGKA